MVSLSFGLKSGQMLAIVCGGRRGSARACMGAGTEADISWLMSSSRASSDSDSAAGLAMAGGGCRMRLQGVLAERLHGQQRDQKGGRGGEGPGCLRAPARAGDG